MRGEIQMSSESIEDKADRLLRLPEVEKVTGFRKTRLYQLIKDGQFPPVIKIGRSRLWKASSIQEWIRSL